MSVKRIEISFYEDLRANPINLIDYISDGLVQLSVIDKDIFPLDRFHNDIIVGQGYSVLDAALNIKNMIKGLGATHIAWRNLPEVMGQDPVCIHARVSLYCPHLEMVSK